MPRSRPLVPMAPRLASAHTRSSGPLLDILRLLTWAGRALGCRPPVALGEAAPGTGHLAGSLRPCPPRGPGHNTGSSAQALPHSSHCRLPACTATWGKPESGVGDSEEPGVPLISPHQEGPEEVLSLGVTLMSPRRGLAQGTEDMQKNPFYRQERRGQKNRCFQKALVKGQAPERSCKMSVSNRNPSPPHYWDHMSLICLIVYLPLVPSVCSRRGGMHVCLTHCCVP